jgi:hypothetical protein
MIVRLDLPGVEDYDPSLSWVAKIREDGRVTADLFIYMDDLRPTGPDAEECWRAARKGAATCNHLGIQDAPKKRRAASKTPGPWAGSMIYTDDEEAGVRVLVVRKTWCKAKHLLANLDELLTESDMADHKVLERTRGFLVYVTRTYKPMAPFILVFHLTINSWRPGRDEEGWRMTRARLRKGREARRERPKAVSSRAQIKGRFEGADSADRGRGAATTTSASEQEYEKFVWFWLHIGQWLWVVH